MYDRPIPVGKHSEQLTDAAIEFIQSVRPDFILRFGFGILKGSVLTASPLGVWSYHHGDPAHFRGQPPGFWEMFEGKPTTGTVLQVLGEQLDGGRILERGSFRTIRHSYAKTRDSIYFGASPWVAKVCRQIQSCGVKGPIGHKQETLGRVYREPENKEVIAFLFRTFVSFVAMVANYKLRWQSWNVGIIDAPIEEVAGVLGAEKSDAALTRVKWLPESRDRFRADPFGFQIDEPGKIRILYESFEWRKDRGDIRSVVFDGEAFKDEVLALDAPTHLSYPFVISWEGKRYFIPEHSEARNVSAFELGEDGRAIAKRTIFSHSEMLDATVVEWDGRLWIFAILDDEATNAELNLFYSESLWGPWRAHAQNPVKTDVSNARPAGTPFVYEGTLYRPSQDCGPHYGSGVRINKIERLTPTEFVEHEVTRLAPNPRMTYGHGLHTISSVGAYTLIDASRLKFRL